MICIKNATHWPMWSICEECRHSGVVHPMTVNDRPDLEATECALCVVEERARESNRIVDELREWATRMTQERG